MQGTAADIIKRAMIELHAWLSGGKTGGRMIMQVHDELVFEVEKDRVDGFSSRATDIMCDAAELSVPLLVEAGTGSNWDEAH